MTFWLALGATLFIAYIWSFWRIPRDFSGNDGCAADSERMKA